MAFMNDPTENGETDRDWSFLLGFWAMRLSGHMDRDELFFLECTGSYIRAIDVPCPERLQLSEAVSRKIAQARVYRKGEPWPFIMSGVLLPALGKVFEKAAVHSGRCKAATVSVALEEYRRRQNGRLPERLQLLAPTWIGQIPADPFDGQSLRYLRTSAGYVIYSVGPDKEDNGGQKREYANKTQSEANKSYDIVFTVDR